MGAEATTIKPEALEAKALFVRLTIDFRRLDLFKFWNDVTIEKAFNFVEMLRRNRENRSDRAYSR